MPDALSITTALSNLKTATDLVRGIRGADLNLEKAELKIRIAELAEALTDARVAVLEAQDEIEDLRRQLAEARAAQDVRGRLVQKHKVYYVRSATGDQEDGPFCVRCYETDRRLMPVTPLPVQFSDLARFRCPQCRATY